MATHETTTFAGLHKAKIDRGTVAALPGTPTGVGHLYYGEDQNKLYGSNPTATGWKLIANGTQSAPSQLTELTDVSAAAQTANFILCAGNGSLSGDWRGRELVPNDYPNMLGDSGAGGVRGAVPAPGAGDTAAGKFLKADGTWAVPAGGGSGSDISVRSYEVSGGESINDGTEGTFPFNAESYDTDSMRMAAHSERVNINTSGKFMVGAFIYASDFDSTAGTAKVKIYYSNGTVNTCISSQGIDQQGSGGWYSTIPVMYSGATGYYFYSALENNLGATILAGSQPSTIWAAKVLG